MRMWGNEADRFNNTAVSAVRWQYLKTLLNCNIHLNLLNGIAFGRNKITAKCWITGKLVSTLKHDECGGQTGNKKTRNRCCNDMLDNRIWKKRLMQHSTVIFTITLVYIDTLVQNIFYFLNRVVCECIHFPMYFHFCHTTCTHNIVIKIHQ